MVTNLRNSLQELRDSARALLTDAERWILTAAYEVRARSLWLFAQAKLAATLVPSYLFLFTVVYPIFILAIPFLLLTDEFEYYRREVTASLGDIWGEYRTRSAFIRVSHYHRLTESRRLSETRWGGL